MKDPRDYLEDNKVWWGILFFAILLLFFIYQYEELIKG